ncbi:hypothetical protein [Xenorhabdus stockiae]|uniref:hypothetical protein n=1 Tax=Xenorhabdus stockiae TaxID=351614 RepID=UPI004062B4AF
MKYLISFFIILFSITAFSNQDKLDFKSWSNTGQWGIFYRHPDSHFKILEINKYKEGYLPAFSYLINLFDLKNVDNEYCLIGYRWKKTKENNELERLMIVWKTANYLIHWNLPDEKDAYSYKAIIYGKPFIDMNESVVPYKEAEGAQALYAKEGVIQLLEDCELHGQKITIKPSEVVDIK